MLCNAGMVNCPPCQSENGGDEDSCLSCVASNVMTKADLSSAKFTLAVGRNCRRDGILSQDSDGEARSRQWKRAITRTSSTPCRSRTSLADHFRLIWSSSVPCPRDKAVTGRERSMWVSLVRLERIYSSMLAAMSVSHVRRMICRRFLEYHSGFEPNPVLDVLP